MAEEHEGVVGEVEEGAKRYWWAIIPLVLIGGYFFLRSRSSGSSTTTTLPAVSPDTASGSSSSGGGQSAVFSLSQIQSELAQLVSLASTAPATTPTTNVPIVVTSTVNPGTYVPPVSSNPGPTHVPIVVTSTVNPDTHLPTYVQPSDPYGYTFVGLSTKTSSPPPTKVHESGTPVKAKTSNYGHNTKQTAKTPSVAYSNHGGIRRVI